MSDKKEMTTIWVSQNTKSHLKKLQRSWCNDKPFDLIIRMLYCIAHSKTLKQRAIITKTLKQDFYYSDNKQEFETIENEILDSIEKKRSKNSIES